MEVNHQRFTNLANKRFGEIISEGFKLFFNSYGYIIIPFIVFSLISILINVLLLTDLELYISSLDQSLTELLENAPEGSNLTEAEWNLLTKYLIMNLLLLLLRSLISGTEVGGIFSTMAMCSVSIFLYNKYVFKEADFKSSFRSSFNKRLILVILIIGIGIPLGTIFLFIPAIIIYGFFIFLLFTYNLDGIDHPISKARAISKGAFWKLIGLFIVNYLFLISINFIYNLIIDFILEGVSGSSLSYNINSWMNPNTRNYAMFFLYQLLYSIGGILIAPLFICLLTTMFSSLKAQKDLGYKHVKKYYIPTERYQDLYSQRLQESDEQIESYNQIYPTGKPLESGMYCPFCGYLIKTPKKFCPKCGESVVF
jgi:hypothetical protein